MLISLTGSATFSPGHKKPIGQMITLYLLGTEPLIWATGALSLSSSFVAARKGRCNLGDLGSWETGFKARQCRVRIWKGGWVLSLLVTPSACRLCYFEKGTYPSIHPSMQHLLSTFYVTPTVLGPGDRHEQFQPSRNTPLVGKRK